MELMALSIVFAIVGLGGFIAALAVDASRGWAAEARRVRRSNAEQSGMRYSILARNAEIAALRSTINKLIVERAAWAARAAQAAAGRKAARRRVKELARQRAALIADAQGAAAEIDALRRQLRGALADAEGASVEVAMLRKQLAASDNANRQIRKELWNEILINAK